ALSPLGPPLGGGFIVQYVPSTPYTIAPGNFLDIYVHFVSGAVGNYSGTLQVSTQANTWSVSLQASVIPGPVVTVGSPCAGPDPTGAISFGRVEVGGIVNCTLSIFNPNPQSLTISPIAGSGAAFSITAAPSVTIDPGQSASFPMKFTAALTGPAAGTLTVGTRTYSLTGTGFNSPLSTPILSFDTPTVASNEQHTLTIRLPQPAPVAASGLVNLAFTPTVTAVTNDSAIQFVATSKRVLSFTVGQGSTAVLLNNQAGAVFSTGTTAGRITFTVDAGAFGLMGDPTTTLIVAPLPIVIELASATRHANDLDITVQGFDNSYTAGVMSFSFYDAAGGMIGQAIPADFSQAFASFFKGQQSGSTFLMGATFPVTGNASTIRSVDVTLTNSAGVAHTQRLSFP
ncbi:MAG TPA: hypothetical protein VK687_13460, partial [Bryobacteraceae bacterium]|nr:hypothetical protein [Bryobacteraceae bacterium]